MSEFVVIGGGIAGLTAAKCSRRYRRKRIKTCYRTQWTRSKRGTPMT